MNLIRQGLKKIKSLPYRQQTQVTRSTLYNEVVTKHRSLMGLFDLKPKVQLNAYVAPNATVIGEVTVGMEAQVWYGAVIRGDINKVTIGMNSVIGENTVIHTASCLPNGLPATTEIGNFVTVQSNCTLYSCTIEADALVGHKSVVLEGARLETGCVIGPNSVVPPGRVIPSNQLWAGNPVQDLNKEELAAIKHRTKISFQNGLDHKYEFLPYNSGYLLRKNLQEDNQVKDHEMATSNIMHELRDKHQAQNHI